MAYGLSNSHVTDVVRRCYEAVRSAILATAWLLDISFSSVGIELNPIGYKRREINCFHIDVCFEDFRFYTLTNEAANLEHTCHTSTTWTMSRASCKLATSDDDDDVNFTYLIFTTNLPRRKLFVHGNVYCFLFVHMF